MCFIFTEIPIINIIVSVVSNTFAMHFSLLKLALVPAEVGPFHDTSTLELIFYELADIDFAAVWEVILSMAVKLALEKIAFVSWALKFEFAFASFLALVEISFVFNAVEIPEL